MIALKRSTIIPNSSSERRETNVQSSNEFLIHLGFIKDIMNVSEKIIQTFCGTWWKDKKRRAKSYRKRWEISMSFLIFLINTTMELPLISWIIRYHKLGYRARN